MKKQLSFLVACLAVLSLSAQPTNHVRKDGHHINHLEQLTKADYSYKLASFRTDDYYQFNFFHYDGQNRLVAVQDTVRNEYSVIDSLQYNENGQMVRLSGWQLLDGRWKNVYYIDYTYDAAGNIASRTNYNNFGGEWNLGGIYNYTYNSDNQIVLSTLTMGDRQYQKIEYTYRNGLLVQELWYSFDGTGLFPSEKIGFEYMGGRLIRESDSSSYDGENWDYFGLRTYTYDDYGNCLENHYFDQTTYEAERSIYTYDEALPLNQVLMPWTPEQERPKTYNNVHACVNEQWYTVDVNHTLQYVCDYVYNYVNINAAINAPVAEPLVVSPNPASDFVTIEGLSEGNAPMAIVDAMGRTVLQQQVSSTDSTINVSNLPKGIYVARLLVNGTVRTAKIVKE